MARIELEGEDDVEVGAYSLYAALLELLAAWLEKAKPRDRYDCMALKSLLRLLVDAAVEAVQSLECDKRMDRASLLSVLTKARVYLGG